jgi:acyl-CoA oxidase
MKARCTNIISKVAAECRTILGGHGYSALSRLNEFFHIADVFKTWEGDNTVILIHTSKFLMKTLEKKSNNRLVDLNFVHQKSIKDF